VIRIEVRYIPEKVDSVTRARLLKELPGIILAEFTGPADVEFRSRFTEIEMSEVSPENVNVAPLTVNVFVSRSRFKESVNTTAVLEVSRQIGTLLPKSVGHMRMRVRFEDAITEDLFL